MITPALQLTATERVLPRLALDFTTGTLDPRITFTRSDNTATRINASGAIETVNADTPRFDFDPVTLACKGLLIEESRKNLLLNTDSLATQNVTVAAVAHTLSFYGDGQVVLSGTHLSTVTGTGAYPLRKTYTFTPTAGTLTVTVTGTVQYAQLEAGAFATSYIPTTSAALTRNADVATMTGTNFSDWYNQSEGTIKAIATISDNTFPVINSISDGSTNNLMYFAARSTNTVFSRSGGATVYAVGTGTYSNNTQHVYTLAYKLNSYVSAMDGSYLGTGTGAVPVSPTTLHIGGYPGNVVCSAGWIKQIYYYPQRLINNEVLSITR